MEKQTYRNGLTTQGWGKEGEGEMYGESSMETDITKCKIDSQWEFVLWLKELKQGLGDEG